MFLIGIAAILLSLIAVTVPLASARWHTFIYAPEKPFTHYWTGTLLRNESVHEQIWELYSELRMMTATNGIDSGDDNIDWVKMTIRWDPIAQSGKIDKFEHHSYKLRFMDWTGAIGYDGDTLSISQNDGVYHFQVSGLAAGYYRVDDIWCEAFVRGSYEGAYYPDVIEKPFVSGRSECIERATIEYNVPTPVGGEVVSVNSFALLAPWTVTAIAAITIGFAISKRKLFLH